MDELAINAEELEERFDRIESRWGLETEEFYAARGFGTRIGWGERPALVVIDMARGILRSLLQGRLRPDAYGRGDCPPS
jgi:hypothetical protein